MIMFTILKICPESVNYFPFLCGGVSGITSYNSIQTVGRGRVVSGCWANYEYAIPILLSVANIDFK